MKMKRDFYRVVSRIFHMPDLEFIRYLRSGFPTDIQSFADDAKAGFRQFLDEHSDKDDERLYKLLAVEYTRLFVNGMQGVLCPPYESMYRENVIMGTSTLEVVGKYRAAGLEVLASFHGLPDHIAVELEFLHYVAAKNDVVRHDAFLREHLSRWVHPFAQAIERNAELSFYKHTGTLLATYVADAVEEATMASVVQVVLIARSARR